MDVLRVTVAAAILCLAVSGCRGREDQVTQLNDSTIAKAPEIKVKQPTSKPPTKIVPPLGFYEVVVWNYETGSDNDLVSEIADSKFKWLRLYKNGTYKTNLSKDGKVEGTFSYDSVNTEVTFKKYHPQPGEDVSHFGLDYYIFNGITGKGTTGYYEFNSSGEEKGHVIWWPHGNTDRGGRVNCYWKRP